MEQHGSNIGMILLCRCIIYVDQEIHTKIMLLQEKQRKKLINIFIAKKGVKPSVYIVQPKNTKNIENNIELKKSNLLMQHLSHCTEWEGSTALDGFYIGCVLDTRACRLGRGIGVLMVAEGHFLLVHL